MERPGPNSYLIALAAFALLIPALVFVGINTVLSSSSGTSVGDDTADVVLVRNRVMALFHASPDLVNVTLVSLAGGGAGGTVILVPLDTALPGEGRTVRQVFARSGADDTAAAISESLKVSVDDVVVFTDDDWQAVVQPAGSVVVDFPESVSVDAGAQVFGFGPGPTRVPPDLFGPLLSTARPNESALARLARNQLVWDALIGSFGGAPPLEVDPDDPLGVEDAGERVIRSLASGPASIATLPVSDADGAFEIQALDAALLVAQAAPGAVVGSTTVRLASADDETAGRDAAIATMLLHGARVVTLVDRDDRDANLPTKDTAVVYYDDGSQEIASALAAALGAGEPIKADRDGVAADLTVVVGRGFDEPVVGP